LRSINYFYVNRIMNSYGFASYICKHPLMETHQVVQRHIALLLYLKEASHLSSQSSLTLWTTNNHISHLLCLEICLWGDVEASKPIVFLKS
jgi:hypothetical protein